MGARTPEELETLFEDALLMRDQAALAGLFAAGAVLAVDDAPVARGDAITPAAMTYWGDRTYVADPRRVLLARDVALVVTECGVNVARRDADGAWRYSVVRQVTAEDGVGEKERESWPWT
jgi:hypothetical protein